MGMGEQWPRATAEVGVLVLVVYLLQQLLVLVGIGLEMVALSAPLADRPWTLVLAVYAHATPSHLVANLVALVLFGLIVERRSTRRRFHAFVLATGMLSGIAEVLIGTLVGAAPLVLGLSGATFALMGYVLASNPVTDGVLRGLQADRRVQLVLMVFVAVGITWVTRGERVALIAHFTGVLLGLLAGRARLLRTG